MIRRRFRCWGAVQGVGFRWRARHAAQLYGCTGLCRNEADGSVTLELQGEAAAVDAAFAAVTQGRYIAIERIDVASLPLEEREYGFGTD